MNDGRDVLLNCCAARFRYAVLPYCRTAAMSPYDFTSGSGAT
jgi:hypothetical protein